MSNEAEEIEFEIKPLLSGGYRATLHIFRLGRWWPPDTRIRASEREAMASITARLVLSGFAEAYEWDQGIEEAEGALMPQ